MFEIKEINFGYEKDRLLLKNIHLSASPGEIIWLRGANGSGKTTLLRIITQLIETDSQVYFKGRLSQSREEILSQVTYIPSEPYLFDYLTGKENADFFQALFDIPQDHFESFSTMIHQFGMDEALDQFVKDYSLGMRHKLYWSAVFARETSMYLLDEPFSPLDQDSQEVAMNMLINRAEQGSIILFVSHLNEISRKLATRSLVLENGELRESEVLKEQ